MPMRLPPSIFEKAYDILVEYVGASPKETDRQNFIRSYTEKENFPFIEYKFQSNLGFNGSFFNNCGRLHITCYQEGKEQENIKAIIFANSLLQNLLDKYLETIED